MAVFSFSRLCSTVGFCIISIHLILRHNLFDLLPNISALIISPSDQSVDLPAHIIYVDLTHLGHKDSVILCLHQIVFINQ